MLAFFSEVMFRLVSLDGTTKLLLKQGLLSDTVHMDPSRWNELGHLLHCKVLRWKQTFIYQPAHLYPGCFHSMIILLIAVPSSALLSGTTEDSNPRLSRRKYQTHCVGSKSTCRHAAFLQRTLGELQFTPCSIICILSPDWVAMKCKYRFLPCKIVLNMKDTD